MASRHHRNGIENLVHRIFDRRLAARGGRRQSRRRAEALTTQQLEQRLALAVEVFVAPTSTTLVATPGSDLYLTKVVGDELWVADTSTFVGKKSVPLISTLGTLAITTGALKQDADVETDAFPTSPLNASLTSFVLSKTRVMDNVDGDTSSSSRLGGELYGTVQLMQPDGNTSIWSFTSWNLSTASPAYNVSRINFTSGPGYGGTRKGLLPEAGGEIETYEPPPRGYYVPTAIRLINNSCDSQEIGRKAATLEIDWNQPLTTDTQVTITSVTYDRATGIDDGFNSINRQRETDRNLQPSTATSGARFTLPGSKEAGNFAVVPGTLSGRILLDGNALRFDTRRDSRTLHFPDYPVVGADDQPRGRIATSDGSLLTVTGSCDSRGWVTLNFSYEYFNGSRIEYRAQAPGRVRVSADYAVSQTGLVGGDVTFFAGFNITNPIVVDMLTPGSTVHVASPITSTGDIRIGSTNTRFDSNTTSPGVVRVESPTVPRLEDPTILTDADTKTAKATAEIFDGKLVGIVPVSGSEGSGYVPGISPVITITPQPNATARAAIGQISGEVYSINLPERGSGYTTAPSVTISAPGPGGVQATAVAEVVGGSIASIRITNRGSGYTQTPVVTIAPPPTAAPGQPRSTPASCLAVLRGSISRIDVVDQFIGYTDSAPPLVTISSTAGGTGAQAAATVVDGRVTSISPTLGGTNYVFDSSTTITIAPPPLTPAVAVANVDSTGRISGYTVTNPGSGYYVAPTVSIARPIPAAAAKGTAVIGTTGTSLGQVAEITLADRGNGYRTPPVVTIDPPPPGTGGQTARARAVLSLDGRIERINIVSPGSGYDPATPPFVFIADPDHNAVAETATFNSAVSANEYRVTIADDPNTDPRRGRLFVSPTSTLGKDGGPASLAFLQASQSDVVVEGTVNATSQTVYMESNERVKDLAPFLFTTRANSGVQTGRIRGATVQVVLANELPTPDIDAAVAYNTIDVRTEIDSLRVRAATREVAGKQEPFPYQLAIDELNNLAVDAVAASSFPIVLTVGGRLNFNSALATAGGLVINAVGDFTLAAPVTTTRGQFAITAPNVLLNNRLEVTDATRDDSLDDVVITATAGDILLAADVKATNRVRLVQKNRAASQLLVRRYAGDPVNIPDNGTVTVELPLTGDSNDFTFSKVQVGIDIAHTFVNDLTATLVAPDGETEILLFANVGGNGDNFKDTVLDSDATVPIASGAAPFSGTFRPQQSLAPLAGRNMTGTWKLRLSDASGGDVGQLTDFALLFTVDSAENGKVAGPGRVISESIDIRTDGFVGDPNATPGQGAFFLHTDTDKLEARVGKAVAIEDVDTLYIPYLTAGELVSLRALGYDGSATLAAETVKDQPLVRVASTSGLKIGMAVAGDGIPTGALIASIDSETTFTLSVNAAKDTLPGIPTLLSFARQAVRASLLDTTALDVSAPNGSVKVDIFTPNSVTIGNKAAIAADTAVSMLAAGGVEILVSGGSNSRDVVVLDAPLAGSGGRQVQGVSLNPLQGNYDPKQPGLFASTITATKLGTTTYDDLATAFGLASVRLGDRLLVRHGVGYGPSATIDANGVYTVTKLGSATIPWELTRAADSDTATDLPTNTFVRKTESDGTQQVYQLSYVGPFTTTPITVTQTALVSDIGSAAGTRSSLTFVVSTDAGTNLGVGSLGKMLELHRLNQAARPDTEKQVAAFRFADSVGTISLVEELPRIRRQLDIDGGSLHPTGIEAKDVRQVLVDGSRIVRRFNGAAVGADTVVHGFQFSRNSDQSRLANVSVGGFASGAAVSIDNSTGVLIEGVTLGRSPETASPAKSKMLERYGVLVGQNAVNVTVAQSTILSSTVAGVSIDASASNTVIVGNTIGESGFDNATGILVNNGVHRVGVRPSPDAQATVARGKPNELAFAAGSVAFDALYIGQGVSGPGIAPDARIVGISPAAATITLSRDVVLDVGSLDSAGTTAVSVQFADPGRNIVQWNLFGIRLLEGGTVVTNTDAANNALSGIRIDGGQHTIGHETTPSLTSNRIYSNQGWGIEVRGATATEARGRADQQTIRGNYFIPFDARVGDATVQNTQGAVGIAYPLAHPLVGQEVYRGINGSLVPSTSGSDKGKDSRGNRHFAVSDELSPVATLKKPLDIGGSELEVNPLGSADTVEVRSKARTAQTFVIELKDTGGIDKATVVKEAFSLVRNGTTLVEGTDYRFDASDSSSPRLESIGGSFPLGTYSLTVKSRKADGALPGWITDLNNNVLEGAPRTFTIVLVDVPNKLTSVNAQSGDRKVDLSWSAAVSSAEVEYYTIESSTTNEGNATWTPVLQADRASVSATVTGLVNGTKYWFRIAAVNRIGAGESLQIGPVAPLEIPRLALVADTGTIDNDGITSDGRITILGVAPNAKLEYKLLDGGWTRLSTDTFTLDAGKYAVGDVQVRQSVVDGSFSAVGLNEIPYDIDRVAPQVVRFTSSSPDRTYGPYRPADTSPFSIDISAILSETALTDSSIEVTLDTGATLELKAAEPGTLLRGTYKPKTGENSADLTVASFTAGRVTDLAGNLLTVTRLPAAANNIAAGKAIVIDTDPPLRPTITAVVDDKPQITGIVLDGGITNDDTLLLSGTTEAGGAVEVFNGATSLGQATVSGTTWTFQTLSLPDGTKAFKAKTTDSVGNVGEQSAEYAVTIDTSRPAPPTILDVTDDVPLVPLEVVADGGVTNDTTPTLRGTTDPGTGTRIYIYDDVTLLGEAVVNGTSWEFTTPTLLNGTTYALRARAVSAAGTESAASRVVVMTIDTSAPRPAAIDKVSILRKDGKADRPLVSGNTVKETRLSIAGTAEAGATVAVFDGSTKLGTATVSGTLWSFDTVTAFPNGLPDREYVFRALATDAAGNESQPSGSFAVRVDTQGPVSAPTILAVNDNVSPHTGTVPRDGSTNDLVLFLTGTAEAGTTVEVFDEEVELKATTMTGEQVVTLSTTVGLRVGMVVTGTGISAGTTIVAIGGATSATLSRAVTAGGVEVNLTFINRLGTATFGTVAGSSWSFMTGTLSDGSTYRFKARAMDAAGNPSPNSVAYTVTVDTTAPSAPLITDFMGSRLAGTAEADGTVEVLEGTRSLGQVTVSGVGTWEFPVSGLVDGVTYSFKARVIDRAGNAGVESSAFVVTADTAAPSTPVISGITDNVAPVVGRVPDGGTTNDTTLVLSGTAEAGSTVEIFDGSIKLDETLAIGGDWSYTTATLVEGRTYAFRARATDAAGNASGYSAAYTVLVDTTPPAAPVINSITDNAPRFTGDIPSGGRTNDDVLVLSGTAEAGSTVEIFDSANRLGQALLFGTAWTFTTAALADGVTYAFRARASDAAGNVGPDSAPFVVTVDTAAPAAPVIAAVADDVDPIMGNILPGGRTNDTELMLSGTADVGSIVEVFAGDVKIGEATLVGSAWTFATGTLTDGNTYAFKARAIDAVGNASPFSTPHTVTIDTTPPAAEVKAFFGGVLSGTAEAGSTVEIFKDGGSIGQAPLVETTWSITPTGVVSGATYVFTARATDAAGNVGPVSDAFTVTVDTTPPVAPVITGITDDVAPLTGIIPSGGRTNDTTLLLSGTAEAGSIIDIFDGNTRLGTATLIGAAWSYNAGPLTSGVTYAFRARAVDAAGNLSPDSTPYAVTIDTAAPAAPVITRIADDVAPITGIVAPGGRTNDTVLVLSGTAEAGSTVEIFDGGNSLGQATLGGTSWTFTTATLANGATYSFRARATDAAGNASPDSAPYTVTIDTTPPAAAVITGIADDVVPTTGNVPSGGRTNDDFLVLSGTAEAGSTVEIFNGAARLGQATLVGSDWRFNTARLVNGATYAFRARATDTAGNVAPDSAAYTVTIDTTAPAAPLITGVADDVSPATGNVASGGRTNDTVLVLSGTAEAGSTVEIFDGLARIGQAVLVGTSWTFTTATLANGTTYVFRARATDAVGNVSPDSAAYTVTIDTVPPAAATVTGLNGGVLSGTAEAGSTVEVFDGGISLGAATLIGTVWTLQTGTLAEGSHAFTARATDAAGNVGPDSATTTILIDTIEPVVQRFTSNSPNATYRVGDTISLVAVVSEPVRAGSSMSITLNTGTVVNLTAATVGTTLSGSYVVQPGQATSALDVSAFSVGLLRDVQGNTATSTTPPTGTNRLAVGHTLAVDAAIRVLTPPGFSGNASVIPDRRTTVTSVPITFNMPVTGVSMAAFTLFYNGRSVSLRGASVIGSGANYTLRLPSRITGLRGIYTLQISATAGIAAAANGAPMMDTQFIYWGKGRSVGIVTTLRR
jgi:subtilisin-like proprotein convertase family protein